MIQAVELIERLSGIKATDFSLNYTSKSYKTIKGFVSRYQKYKDVVYCDVGFNSNETNTFFSISNSLLNYLKNAKRPEKDVIQMRFQINDELVNEDEIQTISEELIKKFDFQYGYIHKFPTSKFCGERKVKRGLFSTTTTFDKTDQVWRNHEIGILHGYLKKLYSINYLNESQVNNQVISQFLKSHGGCTQISEEISKWSLSNHDFQVVSNLPELKDSMIVTDDLSFLNNPEAKQFKAKMTVSD
ncbi:hypothetical protein [Marinoscillum pacificum]|uniref:hypothetical protein n=1 Tax=Marinoscillum pacificum TaxID=392723 RepID=UPI0021588C83|nr:hypothetical protein [Marinoscillum pacificum]